MLSKEEKLKYGEALRQQMKEKEEKKRNEDLAKRVVGNVLKSQSDRILIPDPNVYDQKDALIKKLETQDYNPFGKAGGGAPNRRQINQVPNTMEQNRSVLQGYSSQEALPNRNFPSEAYNEPTQHYGNYDQRNISQVPPFNRNQPPPLQGQYQGLQEARYQNSGSGYPIQPTISNEYRQNETDPRIIPQQRLYPEQFENPQIIDRTYQNYPQKPYPEKIQRQPYPIQYNEPQGRSGLYRQDYSQPQLNNQKILMAQFQPEGGRERIKTLQTQEIQDVYKKGGRNLLRLENQTIDQHLVKQKQKLEMQAFLKQQMEEAERRKQEERQKIKREQLEEERRNKQYIQRQNQKLRDEERKKVEDKQRLAEENLKNLAIKKQMEQEAKLKAEKEGLERKIKQEMEERIQREGQNQRERVKDRSIQQERGKRSKQESSESVSQTSSQQNTYSKGFNTNVSRDFVKKQRERDANRSQNDKKLEMFTQQIQKMRDEILDQGEMFQKQIDKIKKEAERAQDEKKRAELEIEKLKLQLEKKNKESQLRLLEALKRNNPYNQYQTPSQRFERQTDSYQQYPPQNNYDSLNELEEHDYMDRKPYGIPTQHPPSPKKPMSKAKKRVYDHPTEHPERPPLPKQSKKQYNWEKDFQLEQSNIGTLEADSKKIPLNIQNGTKLTLSGVQNYGKDAFLFGKSEVKPQRFEGSRRSQRGGGGEPDQLDKLVQKKWEMSTVKDDITNEIEELLKKKDNNLGQSRSNKISKAGRDILSRGALPYDGPGLGTLNSNKASLVSDNGTLDVDKIHGRNQARLRQLKALGVQTVNTNNDDDLNRLNSLLNNYH